MGTQRGGSLPASLGKAPFQQGAPNVEVRGVGSAWLSPASGIPPHTLEIGKQPGRTEDSYAGTRHFSKKARLENSGFLV